MFGGSIRRIKHIGNPLFLEAMTFGKGVKLALFREIYKVSIEGDAQIIVEALNNNKMDPSYLRFMIEGVQDRSKELEGMSFSWVRKRYNQAVNILVKFGKVDDSIVYYNSGLLPKNVYIINSEVE